HNFWGEMDRRMAAKRGAGKRGRSLDDDFPVPSREPAPDARYEQAVFDAKVAAALRAVEREVGFADFAVFRARGFEGQSGKGVAEALALSEATVSRRAAAVRACLRGRLAETFDRYSFSSEERSELARNGLEPNPNKEDEAAFDAAVAEVFHRINAAERIDVPGSPDAPRPAAEEAGALARAGRSFFSLRPPDASARREVPR